MNTHKITEIFVKVDDFCQAYRSMIQSIRKLGSPDRAIRNRSSRLSDAEVITIMICFHLGAHKTLKGFYKQVICRHYRHLFPDLVSYNRFVELQRKALVPFMMFLKTQCLGTCSGISFIDSTPLRVCNNRRIHCHKTFSGLAERGKTSMGWFYGFKLHLITNERGQLLSFYLSKGNVDDRNPNVIQAMTKEIFGKLFGDKGYLSSALFQALFADGIQLITKLRKNMKGHIMSLSDKILLRKRAIIETINDQLKNQCQVEHTRHRSIQGFLMNLVGALTAYCFQDKKPSLNVTKQPTNQLFLIPA